MFLQQIKQITKGNLSSVFIKSAFIFTYISLIFLPSLSFAAMDIKGFVYDILIGKIINPLTGLVMSLIVLFFFYNSAQYLFKSNKSSEERQKIMTSLMWSVIVMFILASIWGLVQLVANTFEIELAI